MLATDNHLGYAERDHRRGDDSFTTFEEILRAARVEHDVDLVLLCGDLFHDNKPSLGCLVRTCSLFRKYVLGDRPIHISLLSDPARNFPTHALPLANFQDPNMNVALPVFSVHGNHDDPVGGTSALDVLATNGYLNYFGHVSSLEDIVVEPILLQKGDSFIALYGIGNVRDERLHRCFRLKKVHFVHPQPLAGRRWFSILVVHQNRGVRGFGSKGGILEGMLAGFGLDLVIWGNEHEQLMIPQPSHGFDVIQPGSSILTSLSAQECNPKQYGILEVRGTSYRLTPFPLRSVRPVVRRTVVLHQDNPKGRTLDAVEDFLRGVVDEMLDEAEGHIVHIPDDVLTFHPNLKYPLMRLAVDFTDAASAPFPQPNLNRFGQQYMDVVANPGELLRPIKPTAAQSLGTVIPAAARRGAAEEEVVVPVAPQLHTLDIRAKVAEVFNHNARDACTLLSEAEVSAAVYAFAEKGERDAIDERIMELLSRTQKTVWRKLGNGATDTILKPDVIAAEVELHKKDVNQRYAQSVQDEGRQALGPLESTGEEDAVRVAQQSISRIFEVTANEISAATGVGSAAVEADPFLANGSTKSASMLASQLVRDHRHAGGGGLSSIKREEGNEDGGAPPLEDLPGDGLDRIAVDHLVAHLLQDQPPTGTKRVRATPRPETMVLDVDNEGADDAHRPVGRATARLTPPRQPKRAVRRGQLGKESSTVPPRGSVASAGGEGPTLNLVVDRPARRTSLLKSTADREKEAACGVLPSAAESANSRTGAVQNLLRKWGSQPQS